MRRFANYSTLPRITGIIAVSFGLALTTIGCEQDEGTKPVSKTSTTQNADDEVTIGSSEVPTTKDLIATSSQLTIDTRNTMDINPCDLTTIFPLTSTSCLQADENSYDFDTRISALHEDRTLKKIAVCTNEVIGGVKSIMMEWQVGDSLSRHFVGVPPENNDGCNVLQVLENDKLAQLKLFSSPSRTVEYADEDGNTQIVNIPEEHLAGVMISLYQFVPNCGTPPCGGTERQIEAGFHTDSIDFIYNGSQIPPPEFRALFKYVETPGKVSAAQGYITFLATGGSADQQIASWKAGQSGLNLAGPAEVTEFLGHYGFLFTNQYNAAKCAYQIGDQTNCSQKLVSFNSNEIQAWSLMDQLWDSGLRGIAFGYFGSIQTISNIVPGWPTCQDGHCRQVQKPLCKNVALNSFSDYQQYFSGSAISQSNLNTICR